MGYPNALDFYSQEAYDEAVDDYLAGPATEAEADRAFAWGLGEGRPAQAWVLSDRDVWYPNPYYQGPPVPHPEDDDQDEALAALPQGRAPQAPAYDDDEEVPF
jgi:hypothetical protein